MLVYSPSLAKIHHARICSQWFVLEFPCVHWVSLRTVFREKHVFAVVFCTEDFETVQTLPVQPPARTIGTFRTTWLSDILTRDLCAFGANNFVKIFLSVLRVKGFLLGKPRSRDWRRRVAPVSLPRLLPSEPSSASQPTCSVTNSGWTTPQRNCSVFSTSLIWAVFFLR